MSYRRRGYGFKPCPVEVGKEYEVDVTETSRRGEGIARIQGFVNLFEKQSLENT